MACRSCMSARIDSQIDGGQLTSDLGVIGYPVSPVRKLTITLTQRSNSRTNPQQDKENVVNTITVKDGTTLYYKDWGNGQPVVFSHGWPLNADAWDSAASV